jgi:hypothetical protein
MQTVHEGKFIFSQLMDFIPWRRLQTSVDRYGGDCKIQTYRCAEQFRVMAFAQLTYRHSLREVEACLRAVQSKLYHLGIRSSISHSNLAHANHTRDWRIYADFAQILIQWAKKLYLGEDLGLDLDATVYALDATTIDLCLSLYLLVAILKKELGLPLPLYTILQILSLIQFEKTPILQALSAENYKIQEPICHNQLLLFE